MHSLLQSHFKVALRVLRYLKESPGCGVQFYMKSNLKLKAYAHADWNKCPKTRKSMALPAQNSNNSALMSMLEREKLSGLNFNDWFSQLRIILGFENKLNILRNLNIHNMGKTIGELHAMLIENEKGLPKKAATPQVLAIQGGKIQKPNKKPQAAKGKGKCKGKSNLAFTPKPKNPSLAKKEHPKKDATCHHCKEVGH
ncbi:hypothetical protein Tco_0089444 [Tanacetum coccineum]